MRRLLALIVVLVGAVPAVAAAGAGTSTDGTLAVRGGDGVVGLTLARGAVLGRVERGLRTGAEAVIVVIAPRSGTCDSLLVWEQDERAESTDKLTIKGELRCEYRGRGMRFRLVADDTAVIVKGTNIALSAVGRGTGYLRGQGGLDDGRYSLDGEPFESLPDEKKTFTLGAPFGVA